MRTNCYRVVTNGFRFRVERLDIEISKSVLEPAGVALTTEKGEHLGFFRRYIANILVSSLCGIKFIKVSKTQQTWLTAYISPKREQKFVSWLESSPTELSPPLNLYLVKEFSSAFEAYQWIKEIDPEADILTADFTPLNLRQKNSV